MSKIKIFSLILVSVLIMTGCSSGDGKVDSNSEKISSEESSKKKASSLDKKEYDKPVYEDDKVKIVLKSIGKAPEGKYVFNAVDLIFEVENKLEEDIALQVESLSVDGKMVDASNVVSSTDIQAKKMADAYVSISDEHGYEIPKINKDIEVNFNLFSWDNEDLSYEFKGKTELD